MVVVVAGAAGLYVAAIRRLAGKGRSSPRGRIAAFAGGLVVIAVAVLPPVATEADTRFSVHVTEHLLLGMAAPVLLALGAPMTLALQASSRAWQQRLIRLLHAPPVAVVTHPVVGWLLFTSSLYVLYFTPLFAWSLTYPVVHELVHLHFVLVGCLFVWPLVGLDPVGWRPPHGARLLSVLLTIPFHAFVGVALLRSERVLGEGSWSLADQHAGAGLLWATGDLLAFAAAGVIFAQWARAEERAAVRADRRRQAHLAR